MKTLLIGQAPSRKTEGGEAFSGGTGARIAGMAKLEPSRLTEFYELRNILDYWPGQAEAGDGDRFPPAAAREAATKLIEEVNERRLTRVIFVGKAVARACDLEELEYLRWRKTRLAPQLLIAILPHPSGINRWYNKAENRLAASLFLISELADREHQPPRSYGRAVIKDDERARELEEDDR